MRSSKLLSASAVLLASATSFVAAFRDTSPYILASLSDKAGYLPYNTRGSSTTDISPFFHLLHSTLESITACGADAFILVNQRGIHASDLVSQEDTPHLHRFIEQSKSKYVDPYFYDPMCLPGGEEKAACFNEDVLSSLLSSEYDCKAHYAEVDARTGAFEPIGDDFGMAENHRAYVFHLSFDVLPEDGSRRSQLRKNDEIFYHLLSSLPTQNILLIYTSSTLNQEYGTRDIQDKEFGDENLQIFESMLKHDQVMSGNIKRDNNSTKVIFPTNSLFDRYQFFTPGIFMCTVVSLFLFGVLAQALVWLGSMGISYQAFEKDPELVRSKQQ
ncbi:hypothetical protein NADFUDRAFT_83763 [Nadsonia fulvescens var. elongata DSM 6958]|uniref:Protein BIG1 n=1 Tax=Nadsonia fulvescens var. elongata DSM 6958 TaxID=857566 RepID=A0A1E3PFQ5_9ASCO|nr:hypothetical protein NADFUDRAFT_83763 [Nadsonia fulvescens var. elongata DSM 6958]